MPDSATARSDARSTAGILNDALEYIENLIRFETRPAKVEVQEEAKKAGYAVGALVAGGIIALYGVAFLLVSLHLGISYAISPWMSAVVIGGFLVLLGGVVAGAGFRKLRRVRLKPERTTETLREAVEWVRRLRL